ncbi:MAG TPA: hypothetical protein VIW27_03580 [Gammaproteobacteria bacterium]
MQNNKRLVSVLSVLFAGLGMGLLIGLIMGLSISPTTKIVMGVLAAGLGAFLGFDQRAFKASSSDNPQAGRSDLLRELRVGSFAFAVIAGILLGMTIRTNELLLPTISESVKKWTDAGYTVEVARQFVALERLRIDPKTGEVRDLTDADKSRITALFSSQKQIAFSHLIRPKEWAADMDSAIAEARALELSDLENLLTAIYNNAPEESRELLLAGIKQLAEHVESGSRFACSLADEPEQWRNEAVAGILPLLMAIDSPNERSAIGRATRALLCKLESSL